RSAPSSPPAAFWRARRQGCAAPSRCRLRSLERAARILILDWLILGWSISDLLRNGSFAPEPYRISGRKAVSSFCRICARKRLPTMNHKSRTNRIHRRTVLALSGAALGAWGLSMRPAEAVSGAWQRLEQARAVIGDAAPVSGAIALELPLVSENGASVPLTLRIDRAMDSEERVETIHLFAPRNPDPQIAVFHLTELAGQAEIATRIRLNESQTVIAVARTASGEVLVG